MRTVETLIYNLHDCATRLELTDEATAELVKAGRLSLTPSGFIDGQSLENLITDRKINADQEAANRALDRQMDHGLQLYRERQVLLAVVREAMPKLLAEAKKRIEKAGAEPLPDLEGRLTAIAAAQ